jgi:hypothetical protein
VFNLFYLTLSCSYGLFFQHKDPSLLPCNILLNGQMSVVGITIWLTFLAKIKISLISTFITRQSLIMSTEKRKFYPKMLRIFQGLSNISVSVIFLLLPVILILFAWKKNADMFVKIMYCEVHRIVRPVFNCDHILLKRF